MTYARPALSERMSRRRYIMTKILLDEAIDAPVALLHEVVADMAAAHPEWDMAETRTWREWERDSRP